jgi:hypothetical protein
MQSTKVEEQESPVPKGWMRRWPVEEKIVYVMW